MTQPSHPSLPLPGATRAPTPAPAPADEPTHPCIRCGRPGVPVDAGLCEECNPLELAQPSATQVHGIAALGIIAFVVVLAVVARAVIAGTGPFTGTILEVGGAPGGLAVTLAVHNAGEKAGATTCRILEDTRPAGQLGDLVASPTVPAGGDVRFTAVVTGLGTVPVGLVADCQSP
ncbi:MAG TPA: hypothetical protein VET90_06605 [Candidatus Binatus sp.]|nr:hypothetical protein [Candidatus Binatus sp.]